MLPARALQFCRAQAACGSRHTLRSVQLQFGRCRSAAAAAASDDAALSAPTPDGELRVYSVRVNALVDEIAQLTLTEVVDLNAALKERLNLPDVSPMAGAMMMPATGMAQAGAAASPDAAEEVAPAKVDFSVILQALGDESKKIALIKEVKKLVPGLNLVQAKKFVEDLPQTIKDDIPEKDAEEMKKQLEAVGGKVEIK